jgi:hypothetical protein
LDFGAQPWLFKLLTNENPAVLLLNPPTGERACGRRSQCFTAAQIEAGVMPGTSNAVPDYESFTERPVVMAAMGRNGEYPSLTVNQ